MARRATDATRLHLGCGPHVFPGWANLDVSGPPGVIAYDLRRPLPVDTATVEFVYSEHFLEHVPFETGVTLLRECARVLRPDGVIRISTPDLRALVDEYLAGRTSEWEDMAWFPATPCDVLNEGMRLWGHRYIWDESRLRGALEAVGFRLVERVAWRDSRHEPLRGLESRPFHGDLIVEATR